MMQVFDNGERPLGKYSNRENTRSCGAVVLKGKYQIFYFFGFSVIF